MGNEVYFINPPEPNWKWKKSTFKRIQTEFKGLYLVDQTLNVPYNLKFRFPKAFYFFMKKHVKKMERQLGIPDLVWSFDLGNNYPFRFFAASPKKLFFPADFPSHPMAIQAAQGADLIVSIAQEILDQYPQPNESKLLINHGLAKHFIEAGAQPFLKTDEVIRVGLSGNFLRSDLDRTTLLDIINSHPTILFECFGAYEMKNSNIGGSNDLETVTFIAALKENKNVKLHGAIPSTQLALELRRMDLFLICYDVQIDQSKGTNYHKVMEYLVYGRPIVSNNISAYKDSNLIIMCNSRVSNEELKGLFSQEVRNMDSDLNQNQTSFSRKNSYCNNINQLLYKLNNRY